MTTKDEALNRDHPYVRKMIGCGHGRLFSEPCNECEIVALKDEYRRAVRTVQRVRDLLRERMLPRRQGITFDVYTGLERDWYQDRGDVKRWADNDQPVEEVQT